MHVRTVVAFGAEALDVEFTHFLDEIVVARNVFQLAAVALQPRADGSRHNTDASCQRSLCGDSKRLTDDRNHLP